jgi:hypothetical protein
MCEKNSSGGPMYQGSLCCTPRFWVVCECTLVSGQSCYLTCPFILVPICRPPECRRNLTGSAHYRSVSTDSLPTTTPAWPHQGRHQSGSGGFHSHSAYIAKHRVTLRTHPHTYTPEALALFRPLESDYHGRTKAILGGPCLSMPSPGLCSQHIA